MAHTDRKYEIIEAGGGPPSSKPVLGQNGNQLPPTQLLVFNKDKDNMKKVDHYRIRFDIKQFTQSPLRFTPHLDDVLWVKKGADATCPTSPCNDMPGTLWVDATDPDGEWIDVINMDTDKQKFWFTLNLVAKSDPTSTNYVPVDPGGDNQNSGAAGSRFEMSILGTVALGVTAGLLAFGGAQLLLAQS